MAYKNKVHIEFGTFALDASGSSITGSDPNVTLISPGGNPILRIATIKRLKLWQGMVTSEGNTDIYSNGITAGVIQSCSGTKGGGSGIFSDITGCINVIDGAFAWQGQISDIQATHYDILMIRTIPVGTDIIGQWYGVME